MQDAADMDEDKNCPIHRRPCVNRKEENYFFRLSRYQQQIEARRWLISTLSQQPA